VQQSLDHSFFEQSTDFDGMLRACSHEQLGKLVIDSIQNGVPVSSSDMLPPTKPASSRGIKRAVLVERHSQAENNSSGAPAAAPELACEVQDVDESLCSCRGNCMSFACLKERNTVVRWKRRTKAQDKTQKQICNQPHMSGKRFCLGCKCEITDCDTGRDKAHIKSGRWCVRHGKDLVFDGSRCPNESGQQFYGKQWGVRLRLTARLAFLLRDMMPQDMTAAFDFCRKLRSARQGQYKKDDFMWMALASALAVPAVIDVLWCEVAQQLHYEPT
jgi:hypothetical protein